MRPSDFKLYREVRGRIRRLGLNNTTYTIISDNCWAGFVYQDFNLPYTTPFIGLFLFSPCYIEFLENFDELIFSELTFIDPVSSKYADELRRQDLLGKYPIGILPGGIEIQFLHYKSEKDAYTKWNERKKRINRDNMLVKFSDRDLSTEELIARFDALPFKNKICFTGKMLPYKSVILFREFVGKECVEKEWKCYKKYMNIKSVLNSLKR